MRKENITLFELIRILIGVKLLKPFFKKSHYNLYDLGDSACLIIRYKKKKTIVLNFKGMRYI